MDSSHRIYVVGYSGHDYRITQHVIGPLTDDFEGLCSRLIQVATERLLARVEHRSGGDHVWGLIDTDALLREITPMLVEEGYLPICIDEVDYPASLAYVDCLSKDLHRRVEEANKKTSAYQRGLLDGLVDSDSPEDFFQKVRCRGCHCEAAEAEGDVTCEKCDAAPPPEEGKKIRAWLCDKCIHELDGKTLCIYCFNSELQQASTKEYYR